MTEETLFAAALEKGTPAERAAFLAGACGGDTALRQRMEALLASHEQSGFLKTPAVARADAEPVGAATTDLEAGPADAAESVLGFLAPSAKPDSLGRLDHYEVLEVIGRGGMGVVLRAFDEKLQRIVAVKVLAASTPVTGAARKRFVREARAAAAIRNEHVTNIYAVEEASSVPYLVMEYIGGISLQQRLERDGPLEVKEILRIGFQTAGGLAAAHEQGLVHRDIKPANILLENHVERVKITDFGLARARADASLTQEGVVAGTPQYMAPEQARGEVLDHRADLFSLGSVLYALCTGHPPFRAENTLAVLKRVCEDTPRPIQEINPEVPWWLVEIVAKLQAKDPAERYQSAQEVAELLGRELAAVQKGNVERPRPALQAKRSRRRLAVPAVVLLLATGLLLSELLGITTLMSMVLRRFTPEEQRSKIDEGNKQAGKDDGVASKTDKNNLTPHRPHVPPQPEPPLKAFVVLADADSAEKFFATLAEAVAAAGNGDTIEVRGNGPFLIPSTIDLGNKPLIVRAAPGYWPVLEGSFSSSTPVLRTNAPLVLEGLESRSVVPKENKSWNIVVDSRASLKMTNCRFIVRSDSPTGRAGVLTTTGEQVEVRNCQFILGPGCSMGTWVCSTGGRFTADGNLVAGTAQGIGFQFTFASQELARLPTDVVVHWTRNTALLNTTLLTELQIPKETAGQGKLPVPLRLEATDNIFDASWAVLMVQNRGLLDAKQLNAIEGQALLRQQVAWQDQRNGFPQGVNLLQAANNPQIALFPPRPKLTDWQAFWGLKDNGSLQGFFKYQRGNPLTKLAATPNELSPEDFRLADGSAGKGKGEGGCELGADVDLVGPGPAYERWKKTPAYQEWLKAASQVKVAAPPSDKAFVVLAHGGGAEQRYPSLAEAVTAADNRDTIEVRGNGPFAIKRLDLGDKPLIIRAGAGYWPILEMGETIDPSEAHLTTRASLVLEGLEIRRSIARSPASKGSSHLGSTALYSANAPLRMTNCRFLVRGDGKAFWGMGAPDLQVRNCQFIMGPGCGMGSWACPPGGQFSGEGNVVACPPWQDMMWITLDHNTGHSGCRWARNTFVGQVFLTLNFLKLPDAPVEGKPRAALLRLDASENAFDISGQFSRLLSDQEKPGSKRASEDLLRQLLTCQDRRNGFCPGVHLLRFIDTGIERTPLLKTQAEWQAFWGLEDNGSVQGYFSYQGGNLRAKLEAFPERLTPEDFRLAASSAGKGKGEGGRDLGADVDLVGPGPAYERWKQTPAYQQWLKDTGAQ